MHSIARLIPFVFLGLVTAQKIVLTNDDGWAVAQIRAEFDALEDALYDVILSAPALNKSGTGGFSIPAVPLSTPCEFDSCPAGSPAVGFNASDPRLNYVNALPADAVHYGITTLAPQFWNTKPNLVVSGPNVGQNTGISVLGSGTVGAAGRAVSDGVPAVAFSGSGSSTAQESWTDLDSTPFSPSIIAAHAYADLTVHFLAALFGQTVMSPPLLPTGVIVNVNFPQLTQTCSESNVQWVFARALPAIPIISGPDVVTCNNGGRLPLEANVVSAGCFASVSVIDADTKLDVGRSLQSDVLTRLSKLGWSCSN